MTRRAAGKILIVDDTPKNLAAFTAMLEPLGAEILTAASGEEALRSVLREDLALILLDVQMPGLDGYETARLIHSRGRSRQIPIIFLTAIACDEEFVARGYSVGAVDFIVKPVDPQILCSKVDVFLELHEKGAVIREQAEQLRRTSEMKLLEYERWSEARYTSLADAMPALVWTADASGALVYWNQRFAECAGSHAPALDFSSVVHPDDLDVFHAGLGEAVRAGIPWETELRLGSAARGAFRWHLVRAVPTRGADGAISGFIGTGTDMDGHKRAQRALEMLAELTRRLAELIEGEGLASLEEALAITLPVLGDGALLDLDAPEGESQRLGASRPGVELPALDDPRLDFGPATVTFTGKPEILLDVRDAALSGQAATHAGFLRELGIRAYACIPLVSRSRVLGAISFFTADSDRVYGEADLRLAEDVARRFGTALDNLKLYEIAERERRKLEEAGRAKDVFLATLSHELRTPLNAIVGWSHLLRGGELDADRGDRAVETIDRNARALAKLVGDLIDVSRIVAGNLKVDEKVVDLRQVVEAAVDAARPSAEAGGLTLATELAPGSHRIIGDASRLQQVIGNILANAVKFTPRDGVVRIALASRKGRATLAVTDTGPGIAAEFLPFVFEPFRQAQRTHARSQEGLGLGLAIVRHLVELHGGTVRAESPGLGHGAAMIVELPLARAFASEAPASAPRDTLPPDTPAAMRGELLAGVHALIVEDDPDGCELLETVLRGFGATVTTAGTASDAYSELTSRRPDVLVSDIGLPDEDGLSLIRRVRETAGLSELPALALTAYASKRDVAQALAAGFHAHVAKPVEPRELGATIARISGR